MTTGFRTCGGDPDPRVRRRRGSRILLAASLLAGIFAALFLGARLTGAIADFLGIDSETARLALKIAGVVAALPAGFYLVERFFLDRSRRRRDPR